MHSTEAQNTSNQTLLLDRQVVLERLNHDEELLSEMASLFIETSADMLADIEAAIQAKSPKRVKESAHGFKGAVHNFSDGAPYELSRALEFLGRDETLDDAKPMFEALKHQVAELNEALKAWV